MKFDPRAEKLWQIRHRLQQLKDSGGLPPRVKSRAARPKPVGNKHRGKQHAMGTKLPDLKTAELQDVGEEKNRCPFTEEEYGKLVQAFRELDTDGGGDLAMKEVMRIPELVGRKDLVVDRNLFKKMDKDRSGTVDFVEMLRCLYPTTPVSVLKGCVAKWKVPLKPSSGGGEERNGDRSSADWQSALNPSALAELREIFTIFSQPGTPGITHTSLLRGVPTTSLDADSLSDLFKTYCTFPPKGQPYISYPAFTSIMELTYTSSDKNSKAPRLYFQKKDGPTFPLSLPRM